MYAEDSVDLLQVRTKIIHYPKTTKYPFAQKKKNLIDWSEDSASIQNRNRNEN